MKMQCSALPIGGAFVSEARTLAAATAAEEAAREVRRPMDMAGWRVRNWGIGSGECVADAFNVCGFAGRGSVNRPRIAESQSSRQEDEFGAVEQRPEHVFVAKTPVFG